MAVSKYSILMAVLAFIPYAAMSQIKLVSEKNAEPVPYAHIFLNNVFYTYSGEDGTFVITEDQKFDTLMIAHLSYQTKRIGIKDLKTGNIVLQEKVTVLNEVTVNTSRKKWKTHTLLPGRASKNTSNRDTDIPLLFEIGTTEGDENSDTMKISRAVYVPNDYKDNNAVITRIILNSRNRESKDDTKYIPFRVNLMTYDTVRKIPGQKIFAEDFYTGKKRGEQVIIELNAEAPVYLPAEGLCVVVSVYNTWYYHNNGYSDPPEFDWVPLSKKSSWREYSLGLSSNRFWEELYYSQMREQCFNFGVEIKRQD